MAVEFLDAFIKRREIGSARERAIGWLMAGGLALAVVSIGLIGIQVLIGISKGANQGGSSGQSAFDFFHLTLYGAAVGILMVVGGLAFGIYSERTQNTGPQQTEPNFRVLSRMCFDKNFQLLITDVDIEHANKPRFYIRGMLQNGMVGEFETTIAVFYNAGEGMTGEAQLEGKWLGSFTPYIGNGEGRTGEFVQRV